MSGAISPIGQGSPQAFWRTATHRSSDAVRAVEGGLLGKRMDLPDISRPSRNSVWDFQRVRNPKFHPKKIPKGESNRWDKPMGRRNARCVASSMPGGWGFSPAWRSIWRSRPCCNIAMESRDVGMAGWLCAAWCWQLLVLVGLVNFTKRIGS